MEFTNSMPAGLYTHDTDTPDITWDELIDSGKIRVCRTEGSSMLSVSYISRSIKGVLVTPEDVSAFMPRCSCYDNDSVLDSSVCNLEGIIMKTDMDVFIGSEAFKGQAGLKMFITGKGTKKISADEMAFSMAGTNSSMKFEFEKLAYAGRSAFENSGVTSVCSLVTEMKMLEKADTNAFRACRKLSGRLVIDLKTGKCAEIGECAFEGCGGITSLSVNNACLGPGCFSMCEGIDTLTLGSLTDKTGTLNCGDCAFAGCTKLKNVTADAASAQTFRKSYFRNCAALDRIYASCSHDEWLSAIEKADIYWSDGADSLFHIIFAKD